MPARFRPRILSAMVTGWACLAVAFTAASAMAAPAPLSVKLKVSFEGTAGALSETAQMQPCDSSNSGLNACYYGSAASEVAVRGWHATYDPLVIDNQAGSSTAPVTAASLDWSLHTVSDYHNPSGPNYHADCTLNFGLDPAGPPLVLTASPGSDGVKLEAEAPYKPAPTSDPSCFANNSAFIFPQPDSQSLFKAVKTVPFSDLQQPMTEVPASSSDPGVTQLTSDCTAAAQATNSSVASCNRTENWSGKLKIEVICATVSFHELANASAVVQSLDVHPGQTIATAPGERVEITFADGSVARIGPGSKLEMPKDCGQQLFQDSGSKLTVKFVLGDLWAKINHALGGEVDFNVSTERATAGVRGSTITMTVLPGSYYKAIYHVISGIGFVQFPGKPEFDYGAGHGVLIDGSSNTATLTNQWPASAQALVPTADTPPTISSLRLSDLTKGKLTRLRFKLDRKAGVVVRVLRGKKVIALKKVSGKQGQNSVKPLKKALAPGNYVVEVTATDVDRVSITQKTFRIKKKKK